MKLYSAWYCPFAQRTLIALLYKELKFEYIETDPYNKTEQWLSISRQTGAVPVLAPDNSQTIPDSLRTLEYIDHAYPKSLQIYASEAEIQSNQKYWIDYIGRHITPYFYRFLKSHIDDSFQTESKIKLIEGITTFTDAMDNLGPYFMGRTLSAVDIALFPFAYRIHLLLDYYRDFQLPSDGVLWLRYKEWYEVMSNLPAFQQSMLDIRDYNNKLIEFYLPYSEGGGQENVTHI